MTVEAKRHPPWFDPSMPTREDCVLSCVLATRAAATPERDYLLFEDGTRWTYGETHALARACGRGIAQPGCTGRRQSARVAAKRPRRHSRVVRHQPGRRVLRATQPCVSRPPARACDRAVRCARDGRARRTRRQAAGNSRHATRDTHRHGRPARGFRMARDSRQVATCWITPTTARRMPPSSAGTRR